MKIREVQNLTVDEKKKKKTIVLEYSTKSYNHWSIILLLSSTKKPITSTSYSFKYSKNLLINRKTQNTSKLFISLFLFCFFHQQPNRRK